MWQNNSAVTEHFLIMHMAEALFDEISQKGYFDIGDVNFESI